MRLPGIILFILTSFLPVASASGQTNLSQAFNLQLFQLYEVSADQEGTFYSPSLEGPGLISGSKAINERRLSSAVKNGSQKIIAGTSLNLGKIFLQEGDKSAAEKYFRQAYKAFQEADDASGIAGALLYLGLISYQEQLFDQATKHYDNAANLFTKNNMSGAAAYAHILTGQTWLAAKDFEKAFLWFNKGYSVLIIPGQKARIGIQLAELSVRMHKHEDAEKFLSAAMSYYQKSGDRTGQAIVLRDRGILLMKQSAYEAAVKEFEKSLALSSQLSTAKLIKEAYLKIFTVASLMGDHDRSNEVNITYVQLRDSIDNIEKGRVVNSQLTRRELFEREAIQEMLRKRKEVSYTRLTQQELERNRELTEMELERLEKEKIIEDLNAAKKVSDQANMEREEQIRLLEAQQAEQELALSRKELEISRQETLRNSLIIGFISLVVVAGLLYNRYRTQKKSHSQLDKAYSELSETHQKLLQTQEQLVHAQKMASLGQLTAGIAHEIQNPLNFVNNFSELSLDLIKELKDPEASKEAIMNDLSANLEKIHIHGKRADKIVKGMLLHSRTGNSQKVPVNINNVIDELLDLSYHGSRTKNKGFSAHITRNFDQSLPELQVVPNDISRVLVNLFNNSFYALGEKGERLGPLFKPELTVSTANTGEYARIIIRDNGTGIPESVIKNIFDPFFTTKPAGEGTGLGLSLSFDIIVKGHGGTMEVNSSEGEYTEFIITLPLQTS